MRVPESKRALRWEESKISGAAAGRCGFWRPKEPTVGRERKKVNRWEEPSGSISLQGGQILCSPRLRETRQYAIRSATGV